MLEGFIAVLVPLQETVPVDDRSTFPAVNRIVGSSILVFYVSFSLLCWIAFGQDGIQTILTLSLPENNTFATSVQLAYSIGVLLLFPNQHFPSIEIASRSFTDFMDRLSTKRGRRQLRNKKALTLQRQLVAAILLILLTAVASVTMDKLDKIVSLIGGLFGCPLAFIFPPMIHLQLASKAHQITEKRENIDLFVAGMGVLFMLVSTTATLFGK